MRGTRSIVWVLSTMGLIGLGTAALRHLGDNDASISGLGGCDAAPTVEIVVPEAPTLWENNCLDASSTQIAGEEFVPETTRAAETTIYRLAELPYDAGGITPVAFSEETPTADSGVGDVTSTPSENPANPLRRDGNGFVMPEDASGESVEAVRVLPRPTDAGVGSHGILQSPQLPSLSEPAAVSRQSAESFPATHVQSPEPVGLDAQRPRDASATEAGSASTAPPSDPIPSAQTDAMREILRKEAAATIAASADANKPELAQAAPAWQDPKPLVEALEKLGKDKTARAWAEPALKLVMELAQEVPESSPKAAATLAKLDALAGEAGAFAAKIDNQTTARRVRQAGFALSRRLDIWRELPPLGKMPVAAIDPPQREKLLACLSAFETTTAKSREGLAWRQYLLIDALRQSQQNNAEETTRRLAQESLRRLNLAAMTPEQKRFVESEPVAALQAELRRVADGPVDIDAMLANLEQYERTRAPSDSRRLAEACRAMDFALDPGQQRLNQRLDTHYLNANLRLAVAEKLLNRLMPQRPTENAPVYDNVMGMEVYGESVTTSRSAVRMLPSPNRVRMALEVTGTVNSFTTSTSGPATFYNNGTAYYTARKPLEIDMRGIRMEPTQIEVRNDVRLQNLETNFEGVPLLSPLVKGIARQKYEENRPEASREMRGKVAATAKQRVDAETTARLQQFAANLNKNVLHPLNTLDLKPSIVAAETTPERFLMRLRLAGDDQLGSHTPRPQAPSDSMASVQVHESALNNALMRLELDGKTYTLPELSRHIATKFERLEAFDVNPENEDVAIEFAASDAIQVHCEEGQITLTLAIARLSKGSRAWKDFQVRAFYKPQIDGRKVELARDGIIHLSGKKLNTGAQIALRGIFSKAFSRKAPWVLTPESVMKNPALADLVISQFTIDDGWIGAALGPKPVVAARPAILRR